MGGDASSSVTMSLVHQAPDSVRLVSQFEQLMLFCMRTASQEWRAFYWQNCTLSLLACFRFRFSVPHGQKGFPFVLSPSTHHVSVAYIDVRIFFLLPVHEVSLFMFLSCTKPLERICFSVCCASSLLRNPCRDLGLSPISWHVCLATRCTARLLARDMSFC